MPRNNQKKDLDYTEFKNQVANNVENTTIKSGTNKAIEILDSVIEADTGNKAWDALNKRLKSGDSVPYSLKITLDNETLIEAKETFYGELENFKKEKPDQPLLGYLLTPDMVLVDESKANKPNVTQHITGDYIEFVSRITLKIPEDNLNILKTPQECLQILEDITPLADLVLGFEFTHDKDFICDTLIELKDCDRLTGDKLTTEIRYKTAYLLTKTAVLLNHFLIKDQFNLTEFKELIENTFKTSKLEIKTQINISDISSILKDINRIFPELKFNKVKQRVKPNNLAFKSQPIEATPNHSTCIDILNSLIKPFEFTDNSNVSKFKRVEHNNKRNKFETYTEVAIPKPEKIDIYDKTFYVIKGYDWKDRKILRLIITEALKHNGKFNLSFKWVLEMIGELNTGGSTLEEKLNDLTNRFIKYRSTLIKWIYKLTNKIDANSSIYGGNIFLFNFEGLLNVYRGSNISDIHLNNAYLGQWFEVNRNLIKQFTRIPKELLLINTSHHWLSYAIFEKICVLLRTQKEGILKSRSAFGVPIKLKVKTLLDEILNPEELNEALADSRKGYRLKNRILDETKYLESEFKWGFNWIGLTDNLSFNEFYNKVSFEAVTNSDLECAILGEKVIKQIDSTPSKLPLTIEGDIVKTLRKNLKMTQETFAKYIGYSRTLISKIERGSESASPEFIKNLYQKYALEIEKIKK